jgi:RNA polymerase sigma factor (sigma-70 family)
VTCRDSAIRTDSTPGSIASSSVPASPRRRDRRRFSNLRVLPIDVPTANDDFLAVADRDQLERGFRRLSPQQRALLVLRHFEGREPTEIAEILGIPVGTARSRLHHAHRAMRAALDADAQVIAIGGRPA